MKTFIFVSTTIVAAAGCGTAPDASEPPWTPTSTVKQAVVAPEPTTAVAVEIIQPTFNLGSAGARKLVPAGTIARRAPGNRFSSATLAQITFAKKDDGSVMRATAERLLASPKFGLVAADLHSMKLRTDEGLLLLPVQRDAAVAYSVPESGTFTLSRGNVQDHPTVIQNAEEAVNAALDGVAKHSLLPLGPNESLDVVGVAARFQYFSNDHGMVGNNEKVSYKVLLGRLYRGTPVLGPPSLVSLDSDGDVETFRKGWRDITGETGDLALASDATVDSRRDKLMVRYLTLKEATCGYTEDQDPGVIQDAAGAGCRYVYKNPDAKDPMVREVEDWVNVSQDASRPMFGAHKTTVAPP